MAAVDTRSLAAAVERMAQRLEASHALSEAMADTQLRMLAVLEMHTEKLAAIEAAMTREPGPSPAVELLKALVDGQRGIVDLLAGLTARLDGAPGEEPLSGEGDAVPGADPQA